MRRHVLAVFCIIAATTMVLYNAGLDLRRALMFGTGGMALLALVALIRTLRS